ncbi:MAG: hypothetical protein AB1505_14030, partial [Candidatus Latescibacterota bacterium]
MGLTTLHSERVTVSVEDDLSLCVTGPGGEPWWRSSAAHPPTVVVVASDLTWPPSQAAAAAGAAGSDLGRRVPLQQARGRAVEGFEHRGQAGARVLLTELPGVDAALELRLALGTQAPESGPTGGAELRLEVEAHDGRDAVAAVENLFTFERPVGEGGCLILPHGSGYLVPASGADALPGTSGFGGMVGARWAMPVFGLTSHRAAVAGLVDTWWDAQVDVVHAPGDRSVLAFHWRDELGRLAYPRTLLLRFAPALDHRDLARWCRQHLAAAGHVRTLAEKAEETPVIRQYVERVLFRWPGWKPAERARAEADLVRVAEAAMPLVYFFPKVAAGY